MKKKSVILLIVCVMILTSSLTYFMITHKPIHAQTDVPMYITVDPEFGFNVDDSALFFGNIAPGAGSGREFTLYGDTRPLRVNLAVHGTLAEWTHISHNDFILEPHEIRNVTIVVTVPRAAHFGEYESTLHITQYRLGVFK